MQQSNQMEKNAQNLYLYVFKLAFICVLRQKYPTYYQLTTYIV